MSDLGIVDVWDNSFDFSKDPKLAEILLKLSDEISEEIGHTWLKDIAATYDNEDALLQLVKISDKEVIEALLSNDNVPIDVCYDLAESDSPGVRQLVAGYAATPPEILDKLADDTNEYVREVVADNPATPPEALDRLADDTEARIRELVTYNPSTAPKTLLKLADDTNNDVKHGVAQNHNSPPEALAKLATAVWYIRQAVARNPNTPDEIVKRLADDADERVRKVALKELERRKKLKAKKKK